MSYPTRPFRIPNSLKLGPQTQLKRPLIKRKKGENGPFRATFYLKTIELNCFLLPTEAQQKLCILDRSTRQIFKRSKNSGILTTDETIIGTTISCKKRENKTHFITILSLKLKIRIFLNKQNFGNNAYG